ncbi:MAG TPA: cytochrome c oxidase assembly protein [Chloroflexota bacterium]|nr:cytochrome c oxidase assembly protein [Chloroflexota bacterium]
MTAWSLASWSWDPSVLIGLCSIVAAYVIGLRRFRPETLWQEHTVSLRELVCFGTGVGLLVLALVSPIDTLSNQMFSIHMIQHMLLVYIVPPLLLTGMPAWLVRPFLSPPLARRVWTFAVSFVPATIIFNGILVLWHMPMLWGMALVDPRIHALEHLMFLFAGIVVWWPIYGNSVEVPRMTYPMQMLFLFVQSLVPAIIGAFITFSTVVVYPYYLETPKLWGLTPLADQQIAGLVMKLLGMVYLWILFTIRFFQWFGHEEHESEKVIDDAPRR